MPKTFEAFWNELPKGEQENIDARYQELREEVLDFTEASEGTAVDTRTDGGNVACKTGKYFQA